MAKRYTPANPPRRNWYANGSYTGPELPRISRVEDKQAQPEHFDASSAFGDVFPVVATRRKRRKWER